MPFVLLSVDYYPHINSYHACGSVLIFFGHDRWAKPKKSQSFLTAPLQLLQEYSFLILISFSTFNAAGEEFW